MKRTFIILSLIATLILGVLNTSAAQLPTVTVIAEGLLNPTGLAALPNGGLLIAEQGTGNDGLSAGVSLMQPDGSIGRLISGLPSGRDSGDLSGVAMVVVSPDASTIYVGGFNLQQLYTLPVEQALTLPAAPFLPDDLGVAMTRLNNVFLLNPFDATFDSDGTPVVSDASGNGVAIETPNGQTRFFHRFAALDDPTDDRLTIEAVPTGITRVADEYYVTLFGGCPYPPQGGELVAIDTERNQRTLADNLDMPIDVVQDAEGEIWVLEFATFSPDGSCFSGAGYQANTGQLSRLRADGSLELNVPNLNFPGAVLPMPDGSFYITEIFDGELLRVTFDDLSASAQDVQPIIDVPQPTYNAIADADAALGAIIEQHALQPNPGVEMREGDTALAALGQSLFFDPVLSGDLNVSCASCHHPAFGMGDGRVLPIGAGGIGLGPERDFAETITPAPEVAALRSHTALGLTHTEAIGNPFMGQFVPRNSPTILNSALLPVQFWDGRVQSYALGTSVATLDSEVNALGLSDSLVTQALFPIISTHEMAGVTFGEQAPQRIRRLLAERLLQYPDYVAAFNDVFGSDAIAPLHIVEALAAFERRFIFTASAWDAYLAGDRDALTDDQKRGALLFYGALNEAVNCAACHSGDLLTDMDFHNILAPQLGPGKGHGDNGREDWGRSMVTFDRRDQYAFRTPSLRNVELTAPYLHSGAYPTLESVIWHHADMWNSAENYDPAAHLPVDFFSSVQPFDAAEQAHSAAPQLTNGLPLTDEDVADLVAFLQSLTDPQARDLMHFVPDNVLSGLPIDALPQETTTSTMPTAAPQTPGDTNETEADTLADAWHFRNVASAVGLDFQHGAFATGLFEDPAAMMGAGLCWIDYDKDGWLDLYLVNSYAEDERAQWGADLPRNALYRNQAGTFVDVSEATRTDLAMRGNGCIAADLNNDGHTDLFITADGPNQLLWNGGDGTFREGAAQAGLNAPEWNSAAAVADLNGDGWLDIFVGSYIDLDYKVPRPIGAFPQDYYGLPDRLYISAGADSAGNVTFREVSREVGLFRDERALGAIFSDFDWDGDLDLYIANDGQANRLYENAPLENDPLGIGFRFLDTHETADVGDTGSGMGVASADWNGDGQFDLLVTNWEAELNAIYRNQSQEAGLLNFFYSTYRIGMRGLGNNLTGWGTTMADFDHDTDVDMMIVNGRVPVTNMETDPEPVHLYGNRTVEGHEAQFLPWTARVRLDEVGHLLARGSAAADYDNDGDLDMAINTIAGAVVLLENTGVAGNWLMLDFETPQPGITATVVLADGRELVRELHIGSSYLASEDPRLHVGLGAADTVAALRITYPDGRTTELQAVAANQHLRLEG